MLIGDGSLLLTKDMMKKSFIMLLLITGNLLANNNARFAGSFTRMGLGAKAISMGNTGVAAPGHGYSFYYNPALAGYHQQKIFTNSYTFMSLDRHAYFLGFSTQIPPGAGFSIGWLKTGSGDISSFNSIGQEAGTVVQSAHALYGSFSRQFSENFSVGVSIKILLEYIDDSGNDFNYESSGVGGDIGVFYKWDENLSLGAVYKDIGSKLKANTEKIFERGGTTIDHFPRLIRVGAYYKTPWQWMNIAYDFEASNKDEYTNHLGFEALQGRNIALRFGLMDFRENAERELQLFAGAGFDFVLYEYISHLDYAFISSKLDEGSSHLFSWEIYF